MKVLITQGQHIFRTDYSWHTSIEPMRFESVTDAREFARNTFNWKIGQPPLTDEELDEKFQFIE